MTNAPPTARITIIGRESIDIVERVTIGRDPLAAGGQILCVPDDIEMSKLHAAIHIVNVVAMVIDLGSTNGTYLSGPRGRTQVPNDSWIPMPPDSQLQVGGHFVHAEVARSAPSELGAGTPPRASDAGRQWVVRALLATVALLTGLLVVLTVTALVSSGDDGQRSNARDDGDEESVEPADVDAVSEAPAAVSDPTPRVGDGRFGESARPQPDDRTIVASAPVTARWSRPIIGTADLNVLVDDDVVYVSSAASNLAVTTAVGRADGVERWSVELRVGSNIDGIGVIDGVAIIQVCGLNCDVFGLDADGTQLWTAPVSERGVTVKNSRLYLNRSGAIELIDPRTGVVVRSVSGDFSTLQAARPSTQVQLSDGWEVTWFDFDLRPVLGPIVLDTTLLPFADFDGSSLVIAADDGVEYWNASGEVIRTVNIDPTFEVEALLAVGSDLIVIVIETDDGSVIGLDVATDVALELWRDERDLRLDDVIETDTGPVISARIGFDGLEVLDARSGSIVGNVEETDDVLITSISSEFARNALVVVDRQLDAGTSEVRVTDWATGREVWRQTFDGFVVVANGGGFTSLAAGELTFYE